MLLKPKITIFDLTNPQHKTAAELFETVQDVPLVCPHSHVDPYLFSEPDARFSDPAALFVKPDHYVVRMLISQGITYDQLGIYPSGWGGKHTVPEAVWQVFCDQFYLFDGTPSGLWIENALSMVFGIEEKPGTPNAQQLFAQIQDAIDQEAFSPRTLFGRFNIELLSTTDGAADGLEPHRAMRQSGWDGQLVPTFRPDRVIRIGHDGWQSEIEKLSQTCGCAIDSYPAFIQALEQRRVDFKKLGAVATDHDLESPYTCWLSAVEADNLFQKGVTGAISADEARRFVGHMLVEMARMSVEDGLVMQLHVGSFRNHHHPVHQEYGPDMGFDIPLTTEWTRNLNPLLDRFGMDTRLQMILFTLDESSYTRELAALAGAYPVIKLGPPWWFNDSPNGMLRYFDSVMETAGIDNTVGFNDDTRAFLSIPARHDLWRRMASLWLAKLMHQGQINQETAQQRLLDLAYRLAKQGYRLNDVQI